MRNYQTTALPQIDRNMIDDVEGDMERGELLEEGSDVDQNDIKNWAKMNWKTKTAIVVMVALIVILVVAIMVALLFPT